MRMRETVSVWGVLNQGVMSVGKQGSEVWGIAIRCSEFSFMTVMVMLSVNVKLYVANQFVACNE